jgi:hypothetical protein
VHQRSSQEPVVIREYVVDCSNTLGINVFRSAAKRSPLSRGGFWSRYRPPKDAVEGDYGPNHIDERRRVCTVKSAVDDEACAG